jgi:hypothetical protein
MPAAQAEQAALAVVVQVLMVLPLVQGALQIQVAAVAAVALAV